MGTPDFAVPALDILVKNNYNVVAVVTMPDKPAGRGQQVQQSAVKKYALEHGLHVLQPEKLKSPEFINELQSLKADLQIVVAFRMLPGVVWNMPPLGTYNLHASLLPQYRGAAPINWALINGETETGVSTFKLQHEIDTGSVLFQEKVKLTNETTAGELHDTLMNLGAALLLKTLHAVENGNYELRTQQDILQDMSALKHAPKLFKENCRINWNEDAIHVHNLIRGLSPYPAAWTLITDFSQEIQVKIFRSFVEQNPHHYTPGTILSDNKSYLKVACGNGFVHISELQLAGKKRLPLMEFLKGFHLRKDMAFN